MKQLTLEELEEKNVVRLEEIKEFIRQDGFICEFVAREGECNCQKTATYMVNDEVTFWCDEHVHQIDKCIGE